MIFPDGAKKQVGLWKMGKYFGEVTDLSEEVTAKPPQKQKQEYFPKTSPFKQNLKNETADPYSEDLAKT